MTEREELRRKGETVRAALFDGQTPDGDTEAIPGFRDLLAEVNYAGVWSRPGMGGTERMICSVAALAARERPMPMRWLNEADLDRGTEAGTIGEILRNGGRTGGFGGGEERLET